MGECLVIKSPNAVSDLSLRKLGEFIFKVVPNGDSSGFTQVRGIMNTTGSIRVSIDNGSIYKTKDGDALSELTINGAITWGVIDFYIKSNGKEGLLHFENARLIQFLGKSWNEFFTVREVNAPIVKIPLSVEVRTMGGLASMYLTKGVIDGVIDNLSLFPSLTTFLCNYDSDLIGNVENVISGKLKSIELVQSGVSGDISKLFKNCPLLNSLVIGWDKTTYNGDGIRLTNTALKLFEYKTYQTNADTKRTFGNLIKSLSLCDYTTGSSVRIAGNEASLNVEEQAALMVLRQKTTVTITNG